LEYPPETVEVAVFAADHQSQTTTVDLQSGELTEMQYNLQPLPRTPFDIEVDTPGSSVYQGALYVGESPLTLEAPINSSEYFHAETPQGSTGSVIFRVGQVGNPIHIGTRPALDPGAKPLGKARKQYYGAWGRFWVALPVTILMLGLSGSYRDAYTVYGTPVFAENYQIYTGVTLGLGVVSAGFAVESIIRIIWYAHTASKSVPVRVK
jgi:hypothetical protein